MVEDDLELEEDLGEATIAYEDPDGDTVERTVPNEHLAYFQDHWILKRDGDEADRDMVRRIPAYRVYHVDRSVEEFEEEIKTLRDRVQSVADDLRTKLVGGGRRERDEHHIQVERGESDSSGAGTDGPHGTDRS
jgi:hypothetical protein